MTKIFRSKQMAAVLIAVALLVLWGLWYARPLEASDWLGGREPAAVAGFVMNVETHKDYRQGLESGVFSCDAGDDLMGQLLERLDGLRFRRNPLEVLLQFLPREATLISDYSYDLYAYDQAGRTVLALHFNGEHWSHGSGRALPLYASSAVEDAGRELGEWLWTNCEKK